jgi:predicted permease
MTLDALAGAMPALVAVIAPVFAGAGLGWIWARLGRPFDAAMVSDLASNVGTPFLVFAALTKLDMAPAALAEMAAAALLGYALALAAARLSWRDYLPALVFGNAGNMGLPLCLFAYGDAGLALAVAYFAVTTMLQFTLGVGIAAGAMSPARVLRTPVLYAVAAALAFILAGTKPPAWLANTAQLLGGLTIPLMLMALGVSLARLKVASVGRAAALSVLRVAGGAACGIAAAEIMGLSGAARGVLVIQTAMPVAVFNYLFALHYKRAAAEVAGMVLISTLLSFAGLPFLLLYLL